MGLEKQSVHPIWDDAADQIIKTRFEAKEDSSTLREHIRGIARQAGGWNEHMAHEVLKDVRGALKTGKEMDTFMAAAYEKVCDAASLVFEHFAQDQPLATDVFVTVIAIGMLVRFFSSVNILGFSKPESYERE